MTTTTNATKSTTTTIRRTLLTAATVLGAGILALAMAAPAFAGKPGKADLRMTEVTGMTDIGSLADALRDMGTAAQDEQDDRFEGLTLIGPIQMYPVNPSDDGAAEAAEPGDGITDGGSWEPYFPEDEPAVDEGDEAPAPEDSVPDDGADEPDQPAVDQDDVEQPEQPVEPEQPVQELDEPDQPVEQPEARPVEPEQPVQERPAQESAIDEQPSLAYTGGDTTPYLIAGAAIVLFGLLAFRRRREDADRD